MELSDEERRRLAQLEAALAADDPRLASTLGRAPLGQARQIKGRRAGLAGLGFVLGLVALVAGMSASIWAISLLGFLIMFGATVYALSAWKSVQHQPASPRPREHPQFMGRMEDRWNKRQNGQD